MVGTGLVPRVAMVIKTITNSDFVGEKSFKKSIGSGYSISTEQDYNISYVDYNGRQLCHKDIS